MCVVRSVCDAPGGDLTFVKTARIIYKNMVWEATQWGSPELIAHMSHENNICRPEISAVETAMAKSVNVHYEQVVLRETAA